MESASSRGEGRINHILDKLTLTFVLVELWQKTVGTVFLVSLLAGQLVLPYSLSFTYLAPGMKSTPLRIQWHMNNILLCVNNTPSDEKHNFLN